VEGIQEAAWCWQGGAKRPKDYPHFSPGHIKAAEYLLIEAAQKDFKMEDTASMLPEKTFLLMPLALKGI